MWAPNNFRSKWEEKFMLKVNKERWNTEKPEKSRKQRNLQLNCDNIYECRGRIQGDYPIYLPRSVALSEKIIMEAHWKNLHEGVAWTMPEVRSLFSIPVLRKLTKPVYKIVMVVNGSD